MLLLGIGYDVSFLVSASHFFCRAWITEQIENLRNAPDNEESRQKMAELEDNLALRKAQISDLQQKILTADQGS